MEYIDMYRKKAQGGQELLCTVIHPIRKKVLATLSVGDGFNFHHVSVSDRLDRVAVQSHVGERRAVAHVDFRLTSGSEIKRLSFGFRYHTQLRQGGEPYIAVAPERTSVIDEDFGGAGRISALRICYGQHVCIRIPSVGLDP